MTNVVALRPTATRQDDLTDGLVSLAVGLNSAAEHIRSLPLSPSDQYRALVALIEAAKQISRAAAILEQAHAP